MYNYNHKSQMPLTVEEILRISQANQKAIDRAKVSNRSTYMHTKLSDGKTKVKLPTPSNPKGTCVGKKPTPDRIFYGIGKGGRSHRRKNNRRGSGTRRRRHGKQQSLKSFFHF